MDRYEAARYLGLADTELLDARETEDGTAVHVKDGSERLITDDGVFALSDHPATAHLRRWEGSDAPVKALAVAREERTVEEKPDIDVELPVPSEAELASSSEVPEGNADAVLDWVGDDRDRAAQALTVEKERENPRSTLISKLRKLAES